MLAPSLLALPRTLLFGPFLVVKGCPARICLLSQRVDPLHVGLEQVVFVLDLILDHILELFHFDLDDDVVDFRIADASLREVDLAVVSGFVTLLVDQGVTVEEGVLLTLVDIVCRAWGIEHLDLAWLRLHLRIHLCLKHQELVHDSEQGIYHGVMALVLKVALVLFAVHE